MRVIWVLVLLLSVLSMPATAQFDNQSYKIELSPDSQAWVDIHPALTVGEKPSNVNHNYLSVRGAECKWAFPTDEGTPEESWYYFIVDNVPYKKIYIRVSLVVNGITTNVSAVSEPVFVYSSTVLSTIVHLFNQ